MVYLQKRETDKPALVIEWKWKKSAEGAIRQITPGSLISKAAASIIAEKAPETGPFAALIHTSDIFQSGIHVVFSHHS